MTMAKSASSTLAIQTHVQSHFGAFKKNPFSYFVALVSQPKELCVLTAAANWIRLLPTMLVGGGDIALSMWILVATSAAADVPFEIHNIGAGTWILLALGFLSASAKYDKRKSWVAHLPEIAFDALIPTVIAVFVSVCMLGLAWFLEYTLGMT